MSKARGFAYVGALARAAKLATRPGGPSLGDRAVAIPRLVSAVRSGDYTGTSLVRLGLVAAGAAYVVSPVDLLPEGVLGVLGLADDAMVLGWVATTVVEETEKFLEWEASSGRGPGEGEPAAGPTTVRSDVVD
ncbi:DUF1232 domain-containing protein [Phycicoccus sp. CSK15P-2]|uniref:YkvA family protein n=1 Tax=Phycicoccus sp. CSK15P-2 TaxID=2807627 RepID=UPI001952356E|nr:YkvA family protein [Phycicoccus sp. CSK15P-2]MBM6404135.1 DUF1232 domain-containing protein [Phycicoccus sp. CSK15P-2]